MDCRSRVWRCCCWSCWSSKKSWSCWNCCWSLPEEHKIARLSCWPLLEGRSCFCTTRTRIYTGTVCTPIFRVQCVSGSLSASGCTCSSWPACVFLFFRLRRSTRRRFPAGAKCAAGIPNGVRVLRVVIAAWFFLSYATQKKKTRYSFPQFFFPKFKIKNGGAKGATDDTTEDARCDSSRSCHSETGRGKSKGWGF